jgi:hypothetical protein
LLGRAEGLYARPVRCPRCREVAPEGAAICDNCDEILDASFLEGEAPPVAGERTDVGPTPTAAVPGRRDLRPPRLSQRGGWNAKAGAPSAAAERRPYLAPAAPPPPPSPLEEAHRTAGDLRTFFQSLLLSDRIAVGAAAGLLALLCLPWRWTKLDDEAIGLVAAWPLPLLAGGVIALVYLRARGADAQLERRYRAAQLGAAGLAALVNGLFLPFATDAKSVRAGGLAVSLALSRPELGAYLGLVCAVTMALGSLVTMSRR